MRTREFKTTYHTSMLPLATPGGVAPGEPQTLIQAVRAAVERLSGSILRPVAQSFSNLACQPRFMLALLTYCYARQIYVSADIARILATDAPLASVCQKQCPSADMISQFRDENRQAIRACLTKALSFLARQKVEAGVITKVDENRLAEEARRRVIMAMCADSTEAEETAEPVETVNA